jgi:predicted ATPase
MIYLALVLWALGDVERARQLADQAVSQATKSGNVQTLAYVNYHVCLFEALRGDRTRAASVAKAVLDLAREHAMPIWENIGRVFHGWANWLVGDQQVKLAEMRRGIQRSRELGQAWHRPYLGALLAEAEASVRNSDIAIRELDGHLVEASSTGQRWSDAELHRIRGEILLKCDQTDTGPAEEAFLTAIAIAQQQKARSFELRAALALAKLYQSTGRPADAHAVLATALKGFSATPEFPEIEEAQMLLDALGEADEVKDAAAARQRRLELQNKLGQALIWSKGYGANETKAAFTRAKELAVGISNTAERFSTYYGLWVGSLLRAELKSAQQTAENFLQLAKSEGQLLEAAVVSRNLGLTRLYQGAPVEARALLDEALRNYDPDHDSDAKIHFAQDHRAASKAFLAEAAWVLGELGHAGALIDEAVARAIEASHPPTLANTLIIKTLIEILRGDAQATQRSSDRSIALAQEHGLALMLSNARLYGAWARAALGELEAGSAELRQSLAAYANEGNGLHIPWFQGLLAELDAKAGSSEQASSCVNEALAIAARTGEHWTDSFLHRIRGEILLKLDPANTAPAEEAFRNAIAVAQQQKARSFELRAAMSMARLWRDQGKQDEARELLAPVYGWFTEGFDTLDLKEAKLMLEKLGGGEPALVGQS